MVIVVFAFAERPNSCLPVHMIGVVQEKPKQADMSWLQSRFWHAAALAAAKQCQQQSVSRAGCEVMAGVLSLTISTSNSQL